MVKIFWPVYYFHMKIYDFYVSKEGNFSAFFRALAIQTIMIIFHYGTYLGFQMIRADDLIQQADLIRKTALLKEKSIENAPVLFGLLLFIYLLLYAGRNWEEIFDKIRERDRHPVFGGLAAIVYIFGSIVFFFIMVFMVDKSSQ